MSNTVARGPSLLPAGQSLYGRDGGRKYLNQDERQRALSIVLALPEPQALFALTLAWTGARVTEVLALTPSSFQLERGIVAIVTLKRRRHHVREVPLPPDLIHRLSEYLSRMPVDPSTRMWGWHRTTAWRLIKRVMREAEIAGRPASPRGMRHAFGVGTLQSGVPLNLVARWLGHARLSTTAIYADASGPEERSIATRFWGA